MRRASKILNIVLEIGWLTIFFLSPIFFCLWIYGVWQISEYFLFQGLTEIILFVWIIKIILCQRNLSFQKRMVLRILPAIIFIAILGLSTIFSQSLYHSFWGHYFRKMGYLTWLHFFVFFLVLFFNLKTGKQIARIFYVILAATVIAVIYGFLQFLGLDFFSWAEPTALTRIFSTLGQPNFLASWLLLAMPVIVWAMLKAAKRSLIICLLLCSILGLALTLSRGGWIGFFSAFFFFSIVFAYLRKEKRLAVLLIILLGLIVGSVVYLNLHPLSSRPGEPALIRRLKTLSRLGSSGRFRLIWWKNSLDLIKEKPILGYGPEIQRFVFVKYYQPEIAVFEVINTYPDRAHNDILDMLLTSGFLGLAAYLFLLGYVFYSGLKYIFRNSKFQIPNSKFQILCLLTGLTGYLVSLQFSFHIIPTAVYFWGYLAIVLKISDDRFPISNLVKQDADI